GRSASEKPAARFAAVVVVPTPPFWLTTARILAIGSFHVQHCQSYDVPTRSVPRRTLSREGAIRVKNFGRPQTSGRVVPFRHRLSPSPRSAAAAASADQRRRRRRLV